MNLNYLNQLMHELIDGNNDTKLSMLWEPRMLHLIDILQDLERNETPGDIIETGCWRGGTCIFIRAILDELNNKQRTIYAADSFDGVPKPDLTNYPIDSYSTHYLSPWLKAPLEQVISNFKKYNYLDNRTIILPGWFKHTLPNLKPTSNSWSLLRLDGDIYESTIQALNSLYNDLSPKGYTIIDDFGSDIGAAHATRDFLHKINKIHPPALTTGPLCGCNTPGCFIGSPFHPQNLESIGALKRLCLSAYWQK